MKLGVWSAGYFWVELYKDLKTTYPFDEAVWINSEYGHPDYIDVVCEEGNIHRYGWNWEKKKFAELMILTLEDGRNMTPFQYYDSLVNQRKVPI